MLMPWIRNWNGGKEKFNYTYDPVTEGVGYTQMKVIEDVTDGKAHIGVLQANTELRVSSSGLGGCEPGRPAK